MVPSNRRSAVLICSSLICCPARGCRGPSEPFRVRSFTCPELRPPAATAAATDVVVQEARAILSPFQVGCVQSVSCVPASQRKVPIFSHSQPSKSSLPTMRLVSCSTPSWKEKRVTPRGTKGLCSGPFMGDGDTRSQRGILTGWRPLYTSSLNTVDQTLSLLNSCILRNNEVIFSSRLSLNLWTTKSCILSARSRSTTRPDHTSRTEVFMRPLVLE
mmetsp:Transcript_54474/g.151825  ORF Transcript_54474/g.151825 Transcript_54474/m.151825 type:complete len:216 (+) Transcript_54474:870-1517(+)